jgi:hypothetical protein
MSLRALRIFRVLEENEYLFTHPRPNGRPDFDGDVLSRLSMELRLVPEGLRQAAVVSHAFTHSFEWNASQMQAACQSFVILGMQSVVPLCVHSVISTRNPFDDATAGLRGFGFKALAENICFVRRPCGALGVGCENV